MFEAQNALHNGVYEIPIFVGCAVTIISSLIVLGSYVRFDELRRHPKGIIVTRTLYDLILSCVVAVEIGLRISGYADSVDCRAFSFLFQFTLIGSELCFLCLSSDLFTALRNPFMNYKTSMLKYRVFSFIAAGIFAAVLLGTGDSVYGMTDYGVCWVGYNNTKNLFNTYRWVFLYIPLLGIYLWSLCVLVYAYRRLNKGLRDTQAARRNWFRASCTFVIGYSVFWIIVIVLYVISLQHPRGPNVAVSSAIFMAVFFSRGFANLTMWFGLHNMKQVLIDDRKWRSEHKDTRVRVNRQLQPHLNPALRREVLHFALLGIRLSLLQQIGEGPMNGIITSMRETIRAAKRGTYPVNYRGSNAPPPSLQRSSTMAGSMLNSRQYTSSPDSHNLNLGSPSSLSRDGSGGQPAPLALPHSVSFANNVIFGNNLGNLNDGTHHPQMSHLAAHLDDPSHRPVRLLSVPSSYNLSLAASNRIRNNSQLGVGPSANSAGSGLVSPLPASVQSNVASQSSNPNGASMRSPILSPSGRDRAASKDRSHLTPWNDKLFVEAMIENANKFAPMNEAKIGAKDKTWRSIEVGVFGPLFEHGGKFDLASDVNEAVNVTTLSQRRRARTGSTANVLLAGNSSSTSGGVSTNPLNGLLNSGPRSSQRRSKPTGFFSGIRRLLHPDEWGNQTPIISSVGPDSVEEVRPQINKKGEEDFLTPVSQTPSSADASGILRRPNVKLKDMCPETFARIRDLCGITPAQYAFSLTKTTREKFSEGASGAFMGFSWDLRFVIKSLEEDEAVVLLRILPKYLEHLEKNPDSLLVKFTGCMSLTLYSKTLYFVVMENVFPTHSTIHDRYDLKGSWVGRNASKGVPGTIGSCRYCNETFRVGDKSNAFCSVRPNRPCVMSAVLKDNDMNFRPHFEYSRAMRLAAAMRSDLEFLREAGVIDYSLIIGVRNKRFELDKGNLSPTKESVIAPRSKLQHNVSNSSSDSQPLNLTLPHAVVSSTSSTSTGLAAGSGHSVSFAGLNNVRRTPSMYPQNVDFTQNQNSSYVNETFNEELTPPVDVMSIMRGHSNGNSTNTPSGHPSNGLLNGATIIGNPLSQNFTRQSSTFQVNKDSATSEGSSSNRSRSRSPASNAMDVYTNGNSYGHSGYSSGVPSPQHNYGDPESVSTPDFFMNPNFSAFSNNTDRGLFRSDEDGGIAASIIEGPGVYYLGIIDILQDWNTIKRLERWFKATFMLQSKQGMSVMPPDKYADRFEKRVIEAYIDPNETDR